MTHTNGNINCFITEINRLGCGTHLYSTVENEKVPQMNLVSHGTDGIFKKMTVSLSDKQT
jgi:hypothetical protein